jgi:hypothetical protein
LPFTGVQSKLVYNIQGRIYHLCFILSIFAWLDFTVIQYAFHAAARKIQPKKGRADKRAL